MERTAEQNLRFHTLIGKLGIDKEGKRELVEAVSYGRESSSAKLQYHEMERLINHLQALANNKEPDAAVRMRRKILSLCHELGWEREDGKVDYKHLKKWLMKYGCLHKSLMDYTELELPQLVTQIENMLIKQFK